jgi:hypothetical protein
MALNDDFLKAYKDFENAIRTSGYESVLAYESELEMKEKKSGKKDENLTKIRLCRQCRNFLSHESLNFFEASKEMTTFIGELASKLDSAYLPVKKYIMKTLITEDSKLQDAVAMLVKKKDGKDAPVLSKKGELVGYISYELVCAYMSKNNVSSTTKVKACMGTKLLGKKFSTISDTTLMSKIDESKNYLIVNNKDKIIGWY